MLFRPWRYCNLNSINARFFQGSLELIKFNLILVETSWVRFGITTLTGSSAFPVDLSEQSKAQKWSRTSRLGSATRTFSSVSSQLLFLSMRFYVFMLFALYVPMSILAKRQWATNSSLLQKEKLITFLMILSNTSNFWPFNTQKSLSLTISSAVYFIVEAVVDSQGIYYIGIIVRTTTYLFLLYMLLDRAAELTEDTTKFFKM